MSDVSCHPRVRDARAPVASSLARRRPRILPFDLQVIAGDVEQEWQSQVIRVDAVTVIGGQ